MTPRGSLPSLSLFFVLAFASQTATAGPPHDASQGVGCQECHVLHGAGQTPRGEAQASICLSCHNPTGRASALSNVARHQVEGGTVSLDCTDCHDPHGESLPSEDPHPGGVVAHNLSLLRADMRVGTPTAIAPTVFQQRPSQLAFPASAPPFNGACQACHTQTNHHRNDGSVDVDHFAGLDCLACHTHESGFQPTGGCDACHGDPPLAPSELVRDPSSTGATSAGEHALHATSAGYDFPCQSCHFDGMPITPLVGDNAVQLGFDHAGFDGAGTVYDAAPLSAPFAWAPTHGSTVTFGGSRTCSDTYCHSDGTAVSTRTIRANQSPAWNSSTSLSCDGCHENGPTYVRDDKPNGHPMHNWLPCQVCHFGTTQDGLSIRDVSKHVNGVFDVEANVVDVEFNYVYDLGGGRCDNIVCHLRGGVLNHHGGGSGERWGGHSIRTGTSTYYTGNCYEVRFVPNATSWPIAYPPYTYTFDFGDGTTAVGVDQIHQYPSGDPYILTLTARDAFNHPSWPPHITSITPPVKSNELPVAANSVQVSGYTVTLTDLSYDPDFDQCGHSGSGEIVILWGDWGADNRIEAPIDLTDLPSNQVYSHTYTLARTWHITYGIRDNLTQSARVYADVWVQVPGP